MEIRTIKEINNYVREYEKNPNIEDFDINESVNLIGWVRSNRDSGKILFLSFTDGSRLNSIQLVCKKEDLENFEEIRQVRTGASIIVSGTIVLKQQDDHQRFEILVNRAKLLKQSDESYPIQTKEHSMEFLREVAHVRPRTNKFYSIMNVRSELSFAIHNYFHLNNFKWVSAPIITSNDAEGAGESFYVVNQEGNNDFFGGKRASLSVSGQLHAEAYAQTFKRVYTFGPTFRAEKSHTNKHLAEFWMVEPEVAFCDLPKLMKLIESFIKFVIKTILKRCNEEIAFFKKLEGNENLEAKLNDVVEKDFAKLEYREAISILRDAVNNNKVNFEDNDIFFGKDLKTEHERYLCEQYVNGPVFIYNYPKDIKAFYMKLNDDGTTVAACDLLVPGIGELVGGSQREDRYEKISQRAQELGITSNDIQWYLDLRKYGYNKSAGFGLGFERLVMYICGAENIKDTIPFPRTNGSLKF